MKVSVRSRSDFRTYRPSRGTGADPFASTDATILAGAPCLAFPGTGHLAAGGKTEWMLNNAVMDQKHSMCPGTFLKACVIVLYSSKSSQKSVIKALKKENGPTSAQTVELYN